MTLRGLAVFMVVPLLAHGGTKADLPSFQFTYGTGALVAPVAIATNSDSLVYVADEATHLVGIFTWDGVAVNSFPIGAKPGGVAVAPDGTVWVTTVDSLDVRSFGRSGEPGVTLRATHADSPGGWFYPRAIAVLTDGSLLVSCDWRDRILHLTAAGVFLNEFATSPGMTTNTGAFSSIPELSLFADGTILCAVPWFGEVRRYALDGTFAAGPSRVPGDPRGVAVDRRSQASWVTTNDGIVQLSASAQVEGTTATIPGVWDTPTQIAADVRGHLHVIVNGSAIARFGMNPVPVRRPSWGAVKARFR